MGTEPSPRKSSYHRVIPSAPTLFFFINKSSGSWTQVLCLQGRHILPTEPFLQYLFFSVSILSYKFPSKHCFVCILQTLPLSFIQFIQISELQVQREMLVKIRRRAIKEDVWCSSGSIPVLCKTILMKSNHMWRSEGNLVELVLSFHLTGYGN